MSSDPTDFCSIAVTPDPDIAGIGVPPFLKKLIIQVRLSVYGQAALGIIAVTQDAPEPLRAVYSSCALTCIALVISSIVKLAENTMSAYHLHLILCYLSMLGMPMTRSYKRGRKNLREGLRMG
jgi:hypothetical protein